MSDEKPKIPLTALASDLDGTLIPLEGDAEHQRALKTLVDVLSAHAIELLFVTGRHFASVVGVMRSVPLPSPEWIVCDVGTSIYRRGVQTYVLSDAYADHLRERVAGVGVDDLARHFAGRRGLRQQESEKQGPFKLSYYCDAQQVEQLTNELDQELRRQSFPYRIISSVDPFNGDGLIDFLPQGVSKAHALAWWAKRTGHAVESIAFAGDSGNDAAALEAGYRAIIVGNATEELKRQVRTAHASHGWSNRLHVAQATATAGVLEGVRGFLSGQPTG